MCGGTTAGDVIGVVMVTGAVMVVALGGVELDPSTDSGACPGGVNIASVLSS